MDRELAALRRELARHEGGRGRRYAPALRSRLIAWVARGRQRGLSASAIAAQLSLPAQTVARWAATEKPATRMVAVKVVEHAPRTVRVVSPSGFAVDGLTMQEAAALLRVLR